MGVKLLTVQNIISWSCFQLVRNAIPCIALHPPEPIVNPNIKLIDSHGVVTIYHRPIHVSELMLEFPKHLVCRSDSFYIGQKIPPLSEHDQLQLGHKYFLLPNHFFQSVLSFVTIASFFATAPSPSLSPNATNHSNFLKKAAACQQPFDIQRTPSGCLRIRVSDDFISRLLEQGQKKNTDDGHESEALGRLCTTPQLAKDYKQLVRRRKWKPKLETIRERHRRVLPPFGMKKKKKAAPHPQTYPAESLTRSAYPLNELRSMQFAYKPKIRIKSKA